MKASKTMNNIRQWIVSKLPRKPKEEVAVAVAFSNKWPVPGVATELSYNERATWGTCSVCGALHGQWCHSEVGIHLGQKASGSNLGTGEGVHMARIQAAPLAVKVVRA